MISSGYFKRNICLLVVQRGFGASRIFYSPHEYRVFLKFFQNYKDVYRVRIFSFCLISTAIYAVLGARNTRSVSQFLEAVNTAFCRRVCSDDQARSGFHICRSRLVVVEDDRVLMDIIAFVDSLPVRHGLVLREMDYEWSSFRDRMCGIEGGIVETGPFGV